MPFREKQADLWSGILVGNAVVVTTNGILRQDGSAVMGKGTALQATKRFPGIDQRFGKEIATQGNHCIALPMGMQVGSAAEWYLVSFPTKDHWRQPSKISLLERSANEIVKLADIHQWNEIYMPRPGTANGGLEWIEVVMSGALDVLDERFVVVYK